MHDTVRIPPHTRRLIARTMWSPAPRRRIADARGVEWEVADFRSAAGRGLIFRCTVPGVRPEIRASAQAMDALSDEDLLVALTVTDD